MYYCGCHIEIGPIHLAFTYYCNTRGVILCVNMTVLGLLAAASSELMQQKNKWTFLNY